MVSKDAETNQEKLKYPRAIPFIIGNEFCERFCFYGLRTILALYLTNILNYDSNTGTMIMHIFTSLVYFLCIPGAIIADSWLGKFRTILYLSIVYAFGSVLLAFGSIESLGLPMRLVTMLGLVTIAIGSGGIKPCVAAFGAEQFKLPEQERQLSKFFSIFYFAINSGSLISTFFMPVVKDDVKCFGNQSCYPLAFGIPAILMVIALIIYISGKFLYKITPNSDNMLMKVSRCVACAIKTRNRGKTMKSQNHWLDSAEPIHGKKLVTETKILFHILVLYLPLPIFWALYDQQQSRWTYLAETMNKDLGFYTIKADQMQVINPVLILIFIPLFQYTVYPLLNLVGIRRPLQKMALGGFMAAGSFVISGFVQLSLDSGNDLNILWLIPQYVVITAAEILFSITGLEFSFNQAPASMKSVIQSFWLLTTAIGNLIAAIVAGGRLFESQSVEFFVFSVFMALDMLVFIWLAYRYKPISIKDLENIDKK